jgi:hypothetical protein
MTEYWACSPGTLRMSTNVFTTLDRVQCSVSPETVSRGARVAGDAREAPRSFRASLERRFSLVQGRWPAR